MVGPHPAGALHLSAPFNIANLSACSAGENVTAATLNVLARIQVRAIMSSLLGIRVTAKCWLLQMRTVHWYMQAGQANPALLFGVPLLLSAAQPAQAFKIMADGQLADVSTHQLLELLCCNLR
jgi:hypothetical protein